MRRILITGGAGMIGSNLAKSLLKKGDEVYIADNLWRGKKENLFENEVPVIDFSTHFFEIDLSIPNSLDPYLKNIDYVVHLADIVAGINFVFSNQGYIFRQNMLINSNVFDTIRRNENQIKGIVNVGTACSFPLDLQNSFEAKQLEERQLYPANPESAYGWSKLMGQYELDLLEKETKIQTVSLMFHNVYGSPTDYGERSQVIPSLINKAIEFPNESFNVWGSGKQGRAFIHVDDIVNAIELSLDKGWGNSPIQIGPSNCTTIKEIAEIIVEISGKQMPIEYDLSKPEGDLARAANYSKAKEILGWEPKVTLQEGLSELYNWIETDKLKNKN
jgi:GDP-D-mannose 3',5'-epimerase